MATSSFFRTFGKAALVLALGCLTASPGMGQDSKKNGATQSPQALLLKLNQVTGRDTMQGELQWLLAHPAQTKKLLAYAVPLAKDNNQAVNYNAALILARIGRIQKNLPACEAFYKICMRDAAALFSEAGILESYGGLSDVYFENRKYAECVGICKEVLAFKMDDRDVLPVGKGDDLRKLLFVNKVGDIYISNRPDENFNPTQRLQSVFVRSFIMATAKSGKANEALELIDKLLDTNEDSWALYQLKGQVAHSVGKYEDAIKAYDEALDRIDKDKKLSKDDRATLRENCRYIESSIYIDMGKIGKAAEILEDLLKAKPDNAGYLNDLGYILADSDQRLAEAEKMIRKAIDLERAKRKKDPDLTPDEDHDSGAYLDSLGWVLFKEKKFKEAKEVMLKAVEDKNTQHIEIYDHYGDVLEALGEHAAAVAAWHKAIEVASDSRRDQERKVTVQKKIDNQKK